ncbi:hypothetical protein [Spirillospora sp. NPDC047279]|uniref:hypothetical protein n=1 Tax=Spirillospora sp. NPDC047279 TaxID=3155478 RepID=UPI0033C1E310
MLPRNRTNTTTLTSRAGKGALITAAVLALAAPLTPAAAATGRQASAATSAAVPPPPTGCGQTYTREWPYLYYFWKNCSATNARVLVVYYSGGRETICVESNWYRYLGRTLESGGAPLLSYTDRVGTCP